MRVFQRILAVVGVAIATIIGADLLISSTYADEIVVYRDENFSGPKVTFQQDQPDLVTIGIDNAISSIRVRSGLWEFCDRKNYRGRCLVLDRNANELSQLALNERISSFRRLRPNGSSGNWGAVANRRRAEIIVYEDYNQTGSSLRITDDIKDLKDTGINDKISSVRVVSGVWRLCEDRNFRPRCETVRGDVDRLGSIGMDNLTSSVLLVSDTSSNQPFSQVNVRGQPVIEVYRDSNYRGPSLEISGAVPDLRNYSADRAISSLRVVSGRWELCESRNYNGKCVEVTGNVDNLFFYGLDDRIVSLRPVGGTSGYNRRPQSQNWGVGNRGPWGTSSGSGSTPSWRAPPPANRGYAEIIVYTDRNFRGTSRRVTGPVRDFVRTGINDRISSVRVIAGVWQLCEDKNYGDRCEILSGDQGDLSRIGIDNLVSSVRPVQTSARPVSRGPEIVVFLDRDFKGQRKSFTDAVNDLNRYGINDQISSVRVISGTWQLCEDNNYRDRCEIVDGDQPNLGRIGVDGIVSSLRPVARY